MANEKTNTEPTIDIANGKKLLYTCKHRMDKPNPSSNGALGKYDCKILKKLYCMVEGECNWHKPEDGPIIE